jgi:hypothetical protein
MGPFEELYRTLVLFGRLAGMERTQVFALAGFGVHLPRIQTVLTGFQFSDHTSMQAGFVP